MRKSSGEGNPVEDLLRAFLTFKNGWLFLGCGHLPMGRPLEQVKLVLGVCRECSPLRAGDTHGPVSQDPFQLNI